MPSNPARRLPVVLIAGAALVASALLPATAAAIVNGAPADRADYPFYAVVGAGTHCGGALVAPDRVLTAAHCEDLVNQQRTVTVGPHDEPRTVTKLAAHPEEVRWARSPGGGFGLPTADLLILQLDRPITDIAPIPVATAAQRLTAPGQRVTIIGRGVPVDGQEPRDMIFRSAAEVVVPDAACRSTLRGAFARTWALCTLDPRAVADPKGPPPFVSTCHGDSGGPLLVTRDGVTSTIGTVSGGAECGSAQGDVYGDTVAGRAFVLDPTPQWEPYATERPRVRGRVRVGGTVRCAVPWLVAPRTTVDTFTIRGRGHDVDFAEGGRGGTYRVRPRDRGRHIACQANGFSGGGNFVTKRSPPVRVAR